MAAQARKFGARIAERRHELKLTGRQLLARMEQLGDKSINTNQLSRYENGGAMPGEQRQVWFADALETTVGDLHAGPIEERQPGKTPDVIGKLAGPVSPEDFARLEAKVDQILDWIDEQTQAELGEGGDAESPPDAPRKPRSAEQ